MIIPLLIASALVLLCIVSIKAMYRFGVPSLIFFILLGMLVGTDGIFGIDFENYDVAEGISYVAIVIIIFFGGFSTKWDTARPIVVKAALMSSLGTIMTAVIAGLFCAFVLRIPIIYGLLFGAVVSSTDAASVFSILRSRKLGLKNNLAPLLEIESGSNDPFSYMMTVILIAVLQASRAEAGSSWTGIVGMFFVQIVAAVLVAIGMYYFTIVLLRKLHLQIEGLYPIMLLASVFFSFAICTLVKGNGLLCVYIMGIAIGNSKFPNRKSMVNFFDGISWIMQISMFFVLGLLSFPSHLHGLIIPGTLISIFMIVLARPLTTFAILRWFKMPLRQQAFVSWVGLRGSASIVFAIVAVKAVGDMLPYDLFHLVFYVALFSILLQGTLIPFFAKKLRVADESEENSVMETFTDFIDEGKTKLYEFKILPDDKILGKQIHELEIPEDVLILMISRGDNIIVPRGSTELKRDDVLVVTGESFEFFEALRA
ncbi:MAG: potassium/proton antiporter [Defluviitaleaceae bacterium]|nr:potassium/proton antiporter [Defluviitaleaceae bacterium]